MPSSPYRDCIEPLEPRRLFASLSAELIDGDVIITGTNRMDLVKVDLRKNGTVLVVHSTGHNLFDRLTDTGAGDQQLIRVRLERVKRLTFFAKAGNDQLRLMDPSLDLKMRLVLGAGDDQAATGAGDDVLIGGAGNDALVGHRGNDSLLGDEGDDDLAGEEGNDLLVGHAGRDILNVGDGDDRLHSRDGATDDVIDGGAGTDKGRVDRGTAGAQETVENTISNLHRIERFGKIRIRDFDFLDEQ